MKTFVISEAQMQEIAGRLNALTVQGIANIAQVMAIVAVLDQIAKPAIPEQSNVVDLKDHTNG